MHNRFKKGSGAYTCRRCKRLTRDTGGDGADVLLCDYCFDLAGEENHVADTGKLYAAPNRILTLIALVASRGGDVSAWAELRDLATQALKEQ